MSLLIKSLRPGQLFRAYKVLSVAQARQASHWYPDYKPGPVPKTEEERIAAAQKYGLLPEEYECYEDGEGFGDYPKLPYESVDSRDPWYPWDNPELRKDFNEPVNVRIMNGLPEMESTGEVYPSHYRGTLYFFAISATFFLLLLAVDHIKILHRICEKQYPTPGVTHYTFDIDYVELERRRKASKCICPEEGEQQQQQQEATEQKLQEK